MIPNPYHPQLAAAFLGMRVGGGARRGLTVKAAEGLVPKYPPSCLGEVATMDSNPRVFIGIGMLWIFARWEVIVTRGQMWRWSTGHGIEDEEESSTWSIYEE